MMVAIQNLPGDGGRHWLFGDETTDAFSLGLHIGWVVQLGRSEDAADGLIQACHLDEFAIG